MSWPAGPRPRPAGTLHAPLRLFVAASLLLHLLVALLLPVRGLRLAGLPTPRRDEAPGPEAFRLSPFLPLGAMRLQVLEIEIQGEPRPEAPPAVPAFVEDEADLAEVEPLDLGPEGAAPRLELPGAGPAAGGGGGGESGQVLPPVLVAMSWPEYPPEARRLPSVPIILAVHVSAAGAVDAVQVEGRGDCPACERAAVASAWRLRFLPATRDGEPIAMWTRFPVTFRRR